MKWEPSDVLRLVALIGALVMFGLGAFMMWQGISAEGAIDIKSSVLTGSIKTGSAGLFIAFLSFAVIVFVLTSIGKRPTQSPSQDLSKSKRLGKGLAALLVACIVSGGLSAAGFGSGFAMLSVFLGFAFFLGGIAYLTFLENE
jgi:hypothetical protein